MTGHLTPEEIQSKGRAKTQRVRAPTASRCMAEFTSLGLSRHPIIIAGSMRRCFQAVEWECTDRVV